MYSVRMTDELVSALNNQINLEFQASYFYLGASTYCAKSNVALPGFKSFFAKESEEERGHAQQLIDYLTQRGKEVEFKPIVFNSVPKASIISYVDESLRLEKAVTDSIYRLIDMANEVNDHHLSDWLTNFGAHQIEAIHELESLMTKMERVGDSEGLYELDHHLSE